MHHKSMQSHLKTLQMHNILIPSLYFNGPRNNSEVNIHQHLKYSSALQILSLELIWQIYLFYMLSSISKVQGILTFLLMLKMEHSKIEYMVDPPSFLQLSIKNTQSTIYFHLKSVKFMTDYQRFNNLFKIRYIKLSQPVSLVDNNYENLNVITFENGTTRSCKRVIIAVPP